MAALAMAVSCEYKEQIDRAEGCEGTMWHGIFQY